MLTVNVAFLAIPGVRFPGDSGDTSKGIHPNIILPSSSQTASVVSAEASVGSILIGLLLVRHIRPRQGLDPMEAVSGWSHLTCVPT